MTYFAEPIFLLLVFLREDPPQDLKVKKRAFLPQASRETAKKMGGTEMEKRRTKDKERGGEAEKSTHVDVEGR